MRNWTDEEINWLEQQLEREGIDNVEWKESLLDHICSVIEEKNTQVTIEEEYQAVKHLFIHEEWNNINQIIKEQMENQKIKLVTRSLKVVAAVSASLLLMGSALKLLHAPGASFCLWSGVVIFGLFGGPLLAFGYFKTDQKKMEWLLLFLSTFFIARFGYGVMARVSQWSDAAWIMILAIAGFALVFMPLNFVHQWRNNENKLIVIWQHAMMLMVCVMLFTLFNLQKL